MPIGSVSQAIAAQAEFIRPELAELVMLQGVLWKRINKSTEVNAISNRPARISFNALTGGRFRTGANLFDNAPLGRGSSPTLTFGTLSAVSFLQASEYSALAEYSTDSTQKAVENYVTLTNRQATDTFAGYMDALVCQSAGDNLLDTVVATSGTNGLVVNNANFFQDNQRLDQYQGGVFQGTIEILSVDIANNTIWLTAPFIVGTAVGDALYVEGSAAVANSGFFGLPYYFVAGNAGNFMGIPRSAFPGKFSTPNIAPRALTPAAVRAAQAQMEQAMGTDDDNKEVVMHMNVDMAAAWENNALTVQSIIRNQESGDQTADMLHKRQVSTMAGREILRNIRARPGIIHAINFKHLFRLETKALDMYEVRGQTVFPTYAADGGVNSTMIFYLTMMAQMGCDGPRNAFFIGPNVALPGGYFGTQF